MNDIINQIPSPPHPPRLLHVEMFSSSSGRGWVQDGFGEAHWSLVIYLVPLLTRHPFSTQPVPTFAPNGLIWSGRRNPAGTHLSSKS